MSTKSNFYKWHRMLGLTALVPVIFWTISGLSHPFMSNWFRPFIAQEVYNQQVQSKIKPVLTIQQVMDQNHITELRNFSLVCFNKIAYYQVIGKDSSYNYYAANTGNLLKNGDELYATWLARFFTQDSVSAIKGPKLQRTFDGAYQPINHLLPVWKVSFARPDGMDIYIETAQSRMGTFNNNTRKALLWVFEEFHTWDFLAAIGGDTFRLIVLLIIVTIMFLSLLSGLTVYGFFWKKFKTAAQNRKARNGTDKRFTHRYHRQIGLIVSFVMFTFVISAAFHLVVKLHNAEPEGKPYSQLISRAELKLSNLQLPVADSIIKRISAAKFNSKTYYQVTTNKKKILYFDANSGKELAGGDQIYAAFLSNYYHSQNTQSSQVNTGLKITQIKQFDNEYGFINKRLPVQKVSYPGNENWYIETTSAKLAAKVSGLDLLEGFSFIFLHKYFYMSWAGKDIRDIVSMLSALGVLVVALLGFTAFIKNK
jgi:hypothetical protein